MTSDKPLQGVRVLDLTNMLSGPLACHQLASMGAEVIKIEPVGRGDLARQLGEVPAQNAQGMGASFLAQNAGKQSVSLNLKDPRGADILRRLVRGADVLAENFRPGVMARLGLDYPALKSENPSVIYCAISGFGQDGPWRDRPAYDHIIQGVAGVMSVTGEGPDRPLRVGYPVADSIGGLTAAMAICAALNAPERGCFLDVSMLNAVLSTMGWAASNYLIAGVEPVPVGNRNVTSAPSGTYQCRAGLINITTNKQEQWEILARHLGLERLLERPEYATGEARKTNREALEVLVSERLVTRDAVIWAEELCALGVPAGEVLTIPQVLAHPQFATRDQVAEYPGVLADGAPLRVLRPGFMVDGRTPDTRTAPPRLGQDTDAVLGELGLDSAALEALRRDGVI
ncbi:CaiB/BaiF CoA transferase family protein [Alkalilacustris brevis]|uniref:CaiB/BaiF CoA transferase family protein n=1 Tax=Alkalilacustris brevis TaxID=2026338 RepID=UPI00192E3E24|nr:CoA transferase [Alkalilacustris brevis]